MERCGARRSFEKPRVEAPPRLQVIGFNVSPMIKAAEAAAAPARDSLAMVSSATAELSPSLPKPATSSPRSALQQLLLHQSPPSTLPTSSNHSLPSLLPPSVPFQSVNHTLTAPGLLTSHKPSSSSPISSNQNSISGLLQPAISPPASANQKCPTGGLLQPPTSPPAANQKWASGVSRRQSPPSAYQSNSSSGRLKSLLQTECAISDVPANLSSGTSFFSSLSESHYARSSSSSAGNQMINRHNAKASKALIEENYEASFRIKLTGDDGHDVKAVHEVNGRLINDQLQPAAKSKKSSWLHDDDDGDDDDDNDHPSAAEKCKKSSWKGVQQITEHSLGNEKSWKSCSRGEEKSKKNSLFMFNVASSPAPEYHLHLHPAKHNAFRNMDFLSSCHLCRRLLGQGQDVFMYSGDKAFCSMECRYQQIVIDERKERCPPPIIRSGASPVFHHTSVTATTTHHPIMINKPHFINTAAAA